MPAAVVAEIATFARLEFIDPDDSVTKLPRRAAFAMYKTHNFEPCTFRQFKAVMDLIA